MAKISRAAGPSDVNVNDPDDLDAGVASYVSRADPSAPLQYGQVDPARVAVGEAQPGLPRGVVLTGVFAELAELKREEADDDNPDPDDDIDEDENGGDVPSDGNSSSTSGVKPNKKPSANDPNPPSPAPSAASPSVPDQTESGSASSTAGKTPEDLRPAASKATSPKTSKN